MILSTGNHAGGGVALFAAMLEQGKVLGHEPTGSGFASRPGQGRVQF
jgi:hypothetical protein